MANICSKRVTGNSSNANIIAAIIEAGEHRLNHRKHDWPKRGERNQQAWVIANDIGDSSHKNNSLLRRLKIMADDGLLEMRNEGGNGARFRVRSA
jgi:hypothetical protein